MAASLRPVESAHGIVIVGAAGVGKTQLARQAASSFAREGRGVRWVSGSAAARSIPLGAFADFVPDADGNSVQLLRRTVDRLLAPDGTRPTGLVCVDDAHELDDLSAVLLQQLIDQARTPVLLTVRADAPAPDGVAALWIHGHLSRLDLPPLSASESLEVIAGLVGGHVDDASLVPLADLARGNPLFLRQIVDGERAAGRLVNADGAWRWSGGFTPSVELTDLIDLRQRKLPPATLEVLEVVSLVGPLEHGILTQLCSAEQIEEAERDGVIETLHHDRFLEIAPAHPLFAEVQRARMGALTRRRILARTSAALATTDQTSTVVLRRASLVRAADLPADPDLMTRAAQCAGGRLDWELASDYAEEAVLAGAGPEALTTLAIGLSFTLRNLDAEEVFARLCEPGIPLSADQRAFVVMSRAAHLFWFLRRVEAAMNLLEAEIAIVDDSALAAALEAMLALFQVSSGWIEAGWARAREAVRRGVPPGMGRLCAAWATIAALGVQGQITDYRREAIAAYEDAGREYNLGQPRIGMMHYHLLALVAAGHVSEARDLAVRVGEDVDDGLSYPFLTVEVLKALVALAGGELIAARDHAARAVEGLYGIDESGWSNQGMILLAIATAQLGDGPAAQEALRRCETGRHPAHALIEPDVRLARAWVTACAGAVANGIGYAVEAADWAREHEQPANELTALEVALRLGDRTLADRVAVLASQLGGPRPTAVLTYATALEADDGDGLLQSSRAFEAIGDCLAAADAAAQACVAFQATGRRGSQHSAAELATRLRLACDNPQTPALVAQVHPLPLTDREREIVTLAGHGLSNRDIASELTLSVRTVEGHLYRASTKLGVRHRREFSGLVG